MLAKSENASRTDVSIFTTSTTSPTSPTALPEMPDLPHHAGGSTEALVADAGPEYLPPWRLVLVTFSLCMGTLLMALDINIIGVAIPVLTTTFQSLDDVAWYGAAYLLLVTAFQPIMGCMYKYFNIKATYLTSIIIFEGESLSVFGAP